MTLPRDPSRIAAIRDFPTWRRSVERILRRHDDRIAGSTRAGVVVNFAGPSLPTGLLFANGRVVLRADYPRLFGEIGTLYNTGGEPSDSFRLPDYLTPPEHGVWAITT